MKTIDGKALADRILARVKQKISHDGLQPKLAVLLVGEDGPSHVYVNLKEKAASDVGIKTDIRRLPAETSDEELVSIINGWNQDAGVHAILVQLPLPAGHDTDRIIQSMDPTKDVDGFHPENLRALKEGEARIISPVHEGILRLIASTDVPINYAKTAIIAKGDIFAEPLNHLLRRAGAFCEIMKPDDLNVEHLKEADIVIVAVGKPNFLKRDMVKNNACIIDVGTNRQEDGHLVGDVDKDSVGNLDGFLTPVPGGVGPMTIAMLLERTAELAEQR